VLEKLTETFWNVIITSYKVDKTSRCRLNVYWRLQISQ